MILYHNTHAIWGDQLPSLGLSSRENRICARGSGPLFNGMGLSALGQSIAHSYYHKKVTSSTLGIKTIIRRKKKLLVGGQNTTDDMQD